MPASVTIKQTHKNALKKILKECEKVRGIECAVGFPQDKVEPPKSGEPSVIDIAIWNNYGTSTNTPARNFMGLAEQEIRKNFKRDSEEVSELIVKGELDIEKFLNLEGEKAKAAIQEAITDLKEPPNAPSTIKRKHSDNPLIDTGKMRQSVTYSVRKTKE